MTQAEEPAPKPPVVNAEAPQEKPAASPAEPAPAAQPVPDTAGAEQPAPKPRLPKAQTEDLPDAEALQKALEDKSPAPKPASAADTAAEPETATKPAPKPAPAAPQPPAPAAPQAPTAAELEQRLQQDAPKTTDSVQQQGDQTQAQPAPEAQATPNAVAERAAEQLPQTSAAALTATAQDQVADSAEVQITQENARSSAEDFATSVAQGLQEGQAQPEARDKDDRLKDVAKLLLAGAAGMAVGKMLSDNRQVALNTGDRVVVTLPDGSQQLIKDDNTLLYRPGSNVRTESFQDGSTRTTVVREDGSQVVTIRDANMNILRRTLQRPDGTEVVLIDDTQAQPVRVSELPPPAKVQINRDRMDEAALREALRREAAIDRRFTLGQIRDIPEVRALVAPVNVPQITFETGSAAITSDQAQQLAALGKVIRESIDQNPREIFMIEGYTDAVGSDAANLALSDRRAESVALALTEYFQVPPENMVVQGYGEQFLLVPTEGPERANRRVAVRRITDLLAQR